MENYSQMRIIESYWTDLLIEFEKNESEEVLQVLKFIDKEVSKQNEKCTGI
ncbi:hypothetical protein B4102_3306 [Heyndrickxia sporothermodurans]|uniref:Uncharacterized protein n=1 Tax=Heyndrickxia sporothermodurans TaxID=46224 RepID=A0A150KVP5_9BACI|nr:hypothetical protein [Heyndrickxia sporothermodurans]KYD04157.1 hypothetical protein B4102_3306 [Heyndrickxia sporothermodurans]